MLQRTPGRRGVGGNMPPIVYDVLRSPAQPLDRDIRAYFEPRFGRDFGDVRVHTGMEAEASARAVGALAYTVGRDVVFGTGQYAPETTAGKHLLAHELTHVVQQGVTGSVPQEISNDDHPFEKEATRISAAIVQAKSTQATNLTASDRMLLRTPAEKVSCAASAPLQLPGGDVIDDPVGVITAAENQANTLLDNAIAELDFTRQQILGEAPIGFPTISDGLATAMQIMGLDPSSERVWKEPGRVGNYTAELLLRRLRLIRAPIGAGSFFFTCLGPQAGRAASCAGNICAGGALAASCLGSFLLFLCEPFWQADPDTQAARILNHTARNFADFIRDTGREGNAVCYERFAQTLAGIDESQQRTDKCPNP